MSWMVFVIFLVFGFVFRVCTSILIQISGVLLGALEFVFPLLDTEGNGTAHPRLILSQPWYTSCARVELYKTR
jgi:hypothetical protein